MNEYKGQEPDFKANGARFPKDQGFGFEMYNFKPENGKMYGYAATAWNTINLAHFGADKHSDSVDGVTVIFVAKGGIVGYYKNATVFRKPRPIPPGIKRTYRGKTFQYNVTADEAGCYCIPPEKRYGAPTIPRRPGMGRHSWFPIGKELQKFRTKLFRYITRDFEVKNPKPPELSESPVATQNSRRPQLMYQDEIEYEVRSKSEVTRAKRRETKLVNAYNRWIGGQKRRLEVAIFGGLRCDVYVPDRHNLLEAKCSTKREYIRMAVGQLLEYGFLMAVGSTKPHLAVLLPEKPDMGKLAWLSVHDISVVWKEKDVFLDNADGLFT
jgi:hypothetical protein